jgi:HSP20 family molecular chaperone IbpA
MSMMMRNPSDMFMPLRQAMDRLLEGSFLWPGRFEFFTGQSFPIDLYESNDHKQYIVEASVPDFKPEEIQITAQGGS